MINEIANETNVTAKRIDETTKNIGESAQHIIVRRFSGSHLGSRETDIIARKPQTSSYLESWNLCVTQDTKLVIMTRAFAALGSPSSMGSCDGPKTHRTDTSSGSTG